MISQSRSVLPPPSTRISPTLGREPVSLISGAGTAWASGECLSRPGGVSAAVAVAAGDGALASTARASLPLGLPTRTKSQIDHLAVIDGAAAGKRRWRRRPRQRQASDRRDGCGGGGRLVPGGSEGPQLRSAVLLGLAPAPGLLPLREPDLPEPARASAPPPAVPLPLRPQQQGGSVRAPAVSPQSCRRSLLHFLTRPPTASLKPEPDWPAPLLPFSGRLSPASLLHSRSICFLSSRNSSQSLQKKNSNIQHTHIHTQSLYIQIIFFQLKGYETREEKASVQSTILSQTLLYILYLIVPFCFFLKRQSVYFWNVKEMLGHCAAFLRFSEIKLETNPNILNLTISTYTKMLQ